MSYIYNAKILIFERVILKYEFTNRPYAYSFFFILELRDYLLIDSPATGIMVPVLSSKWKWEIIWL